MTFRVLSWTQGTNFRLAITQEENARLMASLGRFASGTQTNADWDVVSGLTSQSIVGMASRMVKELNHAESYDDLLQEARVKTFFACFKFSVPKARQEIRNLKRQLAEKGVSEKTAELPLEANLFRAFVGKAVWHHRLDLLEEHGIDPVKKPDSEDDGEEEARTPEELSYEGMNEELPDPHVSDPFDVVAAKMRFENLWNAFHTLSPLDQNLIYKNRVDGIPTEELSEMYCDKHVGCGEAVRKRILRNEAILRSMLYPLEKEESR
jgi:hypothetical protein